MCFGIKKTFSPFHLLLWIINERKPENFSGFFAVEGQFIYTKVLMLLGQKHAYIKKKLAEKLFGTDLQYLYLVLDEQLPSNYLTIYNDNFFIYVNNFVCQLL